MANSNRVNSGSARKSNTGFVGRESPVDMSQALLQGDKLKSIISSAVKEAIVGVKSIEKASDKTTSKLRVGVRNIGKEWSSVSNSRMSDESKINNYTISLNKKTADKIRKHNKKLSAERIKEVEREFDIQQKKAQQLEGLSRKKAEKFGKLIEEQIRRISDLELEIKVAKEAGDSKRVNELGGELREATKAYDKTSKSIDRTQKAMSSVVDSLLSGIGMIADTWINGISKYSEAYESTFTDIASRSNSSSRGETRQYYEDVRKAVNDSGLNGAISIAEDAIPALADAYKQGFIGEAALAKAISDAEAKVLMPWLDTASESWRNLSANLDEAQMNNLRGMQLQLKESQSGNRLLQSGVIGSLTDELAPLLTNIEYNTGGSDLAAEYQAIMQQMVEQGYSENDAYAAVKKLMEADKNQFKALTEGDTATRMYAMNKVQGKNTIDAMDASYGELNRQAASTGSDLGTSSYLSVLGGGLSDWFTKDKAQQAGNIDYSNANKTANNLKDKDRNQGFWSKAIGNIEEMVTATEETNNKIENSAASTAEWLTAIPNGAKWFTDVLSTLKNMLLAFAADSLIDNWDNIKDIGKTVKNLFSKGGGKSLLNSVKNVGKNLLSKGANGAKSLASKAGSGLKSLASKGANAGKSILGKGGSALKSIGKVLGKSGVGSKATSAVGGASLVAGAIMMAKDGIAASKKAKDWGTTKGEAAAAGAVFGASDKGLKDAFKKGASKEDKKAALKNTAGQMAKGAAIGAGIGSFIPGVGTAIGGAVGAGVGLISSIWSGKEVAQGLNKLKKGIGSGISKMGKGLGKAFDSAKDKFGGLKDKISGGLNKLGDKTKTALSSAKEKVGEAKDKVKSGAKKAWNTVKGWFSHASGLDHVPYDGYPAKLHKGEGILTANQNRIYKSNAAKLFSRDLGGSAVSSIMSSFVSSKSNEKSLIDIFKGFKNNPMDSMKSLGGKLMGGGLPGLLGKGSPLMGGIKSVAGAAMGMNPILGAMSAVRDRIKGKKDGESGEGTKSDTDKMIDAMRSCTSIIVEAIKGNTPGQGEMSVDKENHLLPPIKGNKENADMLDLFPTAPSNSTIV